jgi:large subunit ribosomal protein L29
MRAEEIREMGKDDIVTRIRELEEERFRLQFRSATEPLEDPLRLRVIRRDIARLKTVMHEGGGTEPATPAASKTTKTAKATKSAKAPKAKAKRGTNG